MMLGLIGQKKMGASVTDIQTPSMKVVPNTTGNLMSILNVFQAAANSQRSETRAKTCDGIYTSRIDAVLRAL